MLKKHVLALFGFHCVNPVGFNPFSGLGMPLVFAVLGSSCVSTIADSGKIFNAGTLSCYVNAYMDNTAAPARQFGYNIAIFAGNIAPGQYATYTAPNGYGGPCGVGWVGGGRMQANWYNPDGSVGVSAVLPSGGCPMLTVFGGCTNAVSYTGTVTDNLAVDVSAWFKQGNDVVNRQALSSGQTATYTFQFCGNQTIAWGYDVIKPQNSGGSGNTTANGGSVGTNDWMPQYGWTNLTWNAFSNGNPGLTWSNLTYNTTPGWNTQDTKPFGFQNNSDVIMSNSYINWRSNGPSGLALDSTLKVVGAVIDDDLKSMINGLDRGFTNNKPSSGGSSNVVSINATNNIAITNNVNVDMSGLSNQLAQANSKLGFLTNLYSQSGSWTNLPASMTNLASAQSTASAAMSSVVTTLNNRSSDASGIASVGGTDPGGAPQVIHVGGGLTAIGVPDFTVDFDSAVWASLFAAAYALSTWIIASMFFYRVIDALWDSWKTFSLTQGTKVSDLNIDVPLIGNVAGVTLAGVIVVLILAAWCAFLAGIMILASGQLGYSSMMSHLTGNLFGGASAIGIHLLFKVFNVTLLFGLVAAWIAFRWSLIAVTAVAQAAVKLLLGA